MPLLFHLYIKRGWSDFSSLYFGQKSILLMKTRPEEPLLFLFLIRVSRFFFLLGSRHSHFLLFLRMGRYFLNLVDTLEHREEFKK